MKMRDDTQAVRYGTGFALLFLVILTLNAFASSGRPTRACCTVTPLPTTVTAHAAQLSSPDFSTTRHRPGWE